MQQIKSPYPWNKIDPILNKTCDETLMKQTENQKSLSIYIKKKYGPKRLWAEMVWAEMVMGRNGHGPKWLWAEMTRNPLNIHVFEGAFL